MPQNSQDQQVDTLRYQIQAQRTLAQEKPKLTVTVTALVSNKDSNHLKIEKRVSAALNQFVKADWTFSHLHRLADPAGYERVLMKASARIKASDNYNLDERSRAASTEGLSITRAEVDYTFSPQQVAETLKELRLEILAEATKQASAFSKQSRRAWRVGDISYGAAGEEHRNPYASRLGLSSGRHASSANRENDEEDGLTESEKIELVGTITLKAKVR